MLNPMQNAASQCLIRRSAICGLLALLPVIFFSSCIKWSIPIPPPPGSTTVDTSKGSGSYDTSYSVLWQTTVNSCTGTNSLIQTSDGGDVSAGGGSNDSPGFRVGSGRD